MQSSKMIVSRADNPITNMDTKEKRGHEYHSYSISVEFTGTAALFLDFYETRGN